MTPERWHQVTAIFHAAVAREAGTRDAFLAEACRNDPALRQDVEGLLSAHGAAGSFGEVRPIGALPADPVPLSPGTMIGAYRLEALLGGGAQARVYRARDTQINKVVAIKVLPEGWLDDPDRRGRFEREARVLAALDEPHIAVIYGLAADTHRRGLVLEYVEGQTLADELAHASRDTPPAGLPIGRALQIAHQVALALEAAHDKGIVHRDLKPANVQITPSGSVKVFDFGLAQLTDLDEPIVTDAPTVTLEGTRDGLVVGTAAYMSPEQARGRRVTKRTDVWAFGCVLYEMLTGRRAFSGDTITDTLAAVLHQDVDWAALPATTPPAVRRLLMRCLQKDEKNRLHDIADARLDVEDALADAGGTPVALTSPPESGPHQPPGWILDGTATATAPLADRWSGPQFRPREWAALTVASLAIIAAGMMAFIHFRKPAPTAEAVEFAMYPPDSLQLAANLQAGATPQYAVSPDGQQIAFVASSSETVAMIWVRPLSTTTARPVPGTERGGHPFWCPDNRTLGFLQMAS